MQSKYVPASFLLALFAACSSEPNAPTPAATGQDPAAPRPTESKTPPPATPTATATGPIAEIEKFIAEQKIDKGGEWKTRLKKPPKLTFDDKTYSWHLKTNKGDIKVKLLPKSAPMHVSSVIYLAKLGFYDGLKFHRVIQGFMAQGGCPQGTGRGNPGYRMDAEHDPKLSHDRAGVVSTANAGPGTDGSQFFIMFGARKNLDGPYTIFGEVTQGLDTVKALEAAGAPQGSASEAPREELRIDSATILVE
jgi:cyclophilin family peptidyl-prolyl cis-trans isomerase